MNNLFERLASPLEFKRRFTADAAHELRTPLAAIKLQAQVCQISQDESSRLHALSQVALSVDRASRLIDQLLGLARLDPLQSVTNAVSFDLGLLAQGVLKELRPAVHEKAATRSGAAVSAGNVAGRPGYAAAGDKNLLENVTCYTPKQGRIKVGIEDNYRSIRFWVRSSGPGVLADDLPQLTERFYRGQNITAEGSGLGLPIIKRVAELNNAQLSLNNLRGGGLEAALK